MDPLDTNRFHRRCNACRLFLLVTWFHDLENCLSLMVVSYGIKAPSKFIVIKNGVESACTIVVCDLLLEQIFASKNANGDCQLTRYSSLHVCLNTQPATGLQRNTLGELTPEIHPD